MKPQVTRVKLISEEQHTQYERPQRLLHIGEKCNYVTSVEGEAAYYPGKLRNRDGYRFYQNIIGSNKIYDMATLRPDRNYKNRPDWIKSLAQYDIHGN